MKLYQMGSISYNVRRIYEAGQWYNIRSTHVEQPLFGLGGVWDWPGTGNGALYAPVVHRILMGTD